MWKLQAFFRVGKNIAILTVSTVRTLTREGVSFVRLQLSTVFGAGGALLLSAGALVLLTGFVPEQTGHSVQLPMNAAVLEFVPERIDLSGHSSSGSWQVIASLAELDNTNTMDASAETQVERTPFVLAPVFPTVGANGAASFDKLSQPQQSASAPVYAEHSGDVFAQDSLLASASYALGEAPFLPRTARASTGGEARAVVAQNDREVLVCTAPVMDFRRSGRAASRSGRIPASSLNRAGQYREIVEQHAQKYNLSADFVLAIMHTESSFNPQAVSTANALGLMQVVPATAGNEVHAYLNGTPGLPAAASLFDPTTNINYGTTYLHLLGTRHLGGIKNATSRMYCVIAAYNGGPTAVYRTFGGGDRRLAIETVNELTPEQVYERLVKMSPSKETRDYVVKVVASLEKFSALR